MLFLVSILLIIVFSIWLGKFKEETNECKCCKNCKYYVENEFDEFSLRFHEDGWCRSSAMETLPSMLCNRYKRLRSK